jgi:hypothetical protein
MSFMSQTSAFFDELSNIMDDQQQARADAMELRSERPYSSLLTQDEEPTQDYNPQQLEEPDPEVVTRGSS